MTRSTRRGSGTAAEKRLPDLALHFWREKAERGTDSCTGSKEAVALSKEPHDVRQRQQARQEIRGADPDAHMLTKVVLGHDTF